MGRSRAERAVCGSSTSAGFRTGRSSMETSAVSRTRFGSGGTKSFVAGTKGSWGCGGGASVALWFVRLSRMARLAGATFHPARRSCSTSSWSTSTSRGRPAGEWPSRQPGLQPRCDGPPDTTSRSPWGIEAPARIRASASRKRFSGCEDPARALCRSSVRSARSTHVTSSSARAVRAPHRRRGVREIVAPRCRPEAGRCQRA